MTDHNATAPEAIWIDWKRANDAFLAYDEAPDEPFSDCRSGFIRVDIHAAAVERLVGERDALRASLATAIAAERERCAGSNDRPLGPL